MFVAKIFTTPPPSPPPPSFVSTYLGLHSTLLNIGSPYSLLIYTPTRVEQLPTKLQNSFSTSPSTDLFLVPSELNASFYVCMMVMTMICHLSVQVDCSLLIVKRVSHYYDPNACCSPRPCSWRRRRYFIDQGF